MHEIICFHSFALIISMSLIKQKSCSAKASTILESHLHSAKCHSNNLFRAFCQVTIYNWTFDTHISKNTSRMDVKSSHFHSISSDKKINVFD